MLARWFKSDSSALATIMPAELMAQLRKLPEFMPADPPTEVIEHINDDDELVGSSANCPELSLSGLRGLASG